MDIERRIQRMYRYKTSASEGTEFMDSCDTAIEALLKLQRLVNKNDLLPDVSSRLSFARFVAKDYDIRIDGDDVRYAEIATGDNYSESEIYKKWQLLNAT